MIITYDAAGRHDGFTLVEILIVMVVLAAGLLGCEALLMRALEVSRSAIERSQATDLAADLGDRIRANRAAGTAYALAAGTQLVPPPKSCDVPGDCDAAEVAARDLYAWQLAACATLPEVATSVQVQPLGDTTARLYSIVLEWTATGSGTAARIVLALQA